MLGLKDMTGEHASADAVLAVTDEALKKMDKDWKSIIALVTDNPTVMQSLRKKAKEKNQWLITLPCFLHGLNTLIGKIVSHPEMKVAITKNAKIVTFFNASHYWGGQLETIARSLKVTRSLKTNTESRWYSLILQALSILDHWPALIQLCCRPDAQKKMKGLTPVSMVIKMH
ncbi:hypothetical protein K439DRAFT_1563840 [Ramaria rubella]|nr:hypothetical protein K439DRAFT_1563840 [Ramaria rubella]